MSGMMNFVRRHKWKVGMLSTGAAAYALKVYLDARVAEMEREVMEEHLSRARLARRDDLFGSNEKSSSKAIENFLPDFSEAMEQALGLDAVVAEMHALPRSNPSVREKKLELWRSLVVKTITGVVAGAHVLSLLVVFLRVQLNILGGYAYLSTVPGKEESASIDGGVQRDFLGIVKHLQLEGTSQLVAWIEPFVERAISDAGLDDATALVNSSDVQKCLSDVLGRLARSQQPGESPFARFLIPDAFLASGASSVDTGRGPPSLAYLVKETRDVLDAAVFETATKACVDQCIGHVVDGVRMSLTQMPPDADVEGPEGKPYRLLKVLKPIKDQFQHMYSPELGPMQDLLVTNPVKQLSKSVFESFRTTSLLHSTE
eukprot:m.218979 g.218979  ORF g.218979 m.218979 type:complete len:373 (-) comp25733_c0_seq1:1756-2874(-)